MSVWQLKHLVSGQHVHVQLPSSPTPNPRVMLAENDMFGVPFQGHISGDLTGSSHGAVYDIELSAPADVGVVGALTLIVDVYSNGTLFVPVYCQVV